MSEKSSEKSEMSSVEFAQHALKTRLAPPALGSVGARLCHATRKILAYDRKQAEQLDREPQWTANRVKDCWYADTRIKPNADQIRDLEELTGLRYGREELRELDALIDRADALLGGTDQNLHSSVLNAMRSFIRALAGAGAAAGD